MKIPVFDLHCDTPVQLYGSGELLRENTGHVDLRRAAALERYTQFFAFCCVYDAQGKQLSQDDAAKLFQASLEWFREDLQNICRGEQCSPAVCNYFSLPAGEHCSPLQAFRPLLSVEGPEVIDCDPARLAWLQEQGFRMTTLTWNYKNKLAGSCWTGEGLTDLGRAFVREAQRLGIVIDVSHLSEQAFWDLVDITTKPIVASHSNSRACCACPRNLTDDQFRAIRDLGGLVGMNLYAPFLSESGKASFDDVRRHLDRWLNLGGEQTVALGGDLDGCDVLPEGFTGIESYPRLAEFLSAFDTEALFYSNAEHFFCL